MVLRAAGVCGYGHAVRGPGNENASFGSYSHSGRIRVNSSFALAQNANEVTVQGTRVLNTKNVGRTSSGIPIVDVSLSYGVSLAGLDLASHAGATELEKRVHDAAMAACKEIGRQYPDATPSTAECAKVAADKAMVQVHELEAAAGK
jgi:UrcA family protein